MKLFNWFKKPKIEAEPESEARLNELKEAEFQLNNPENYSTIDGFLSTRPLKDLRPKKSRWMGTNNYSIVELIQKYYNLDEETVISIIWVEYVNRIGVETAYTKAKQDIVRVKNGEGSSNREQLTRFKFETIADDFNLNFKINTFKRPDKDGSIENLIWWANKNDFYPVKVIKEVLVETYHQEFNGIILEKSLKMLDKTFRNYTKNRASSMHWHENYEKYFYTLYGKDEILEQAIKENAQLRREYEKSIS